MFSRVLELLHLLVAAIAIAAMRLFLFGEQVDLLFPLFGPPHQFCRILVYFSR